MRRALHDLAALVARIAVGGIFFANGWQKLENGLTSTDATFATHNVPAPRAWAIITMLSELVGGAFLIAGLVVSVVGLVLFAEALAVFVAAAPINPISLNELILLGVTSILLAVVGAGRVSVDHMVVIRRRDAEAADDFAADTEADRVIAALREPDPPPDEDLENTAPHPRPAGASDEAAGDVLVAGRRKPQTRSRKSPPASD